MNAVEYCLLHGLKLAGPEHPAILCAQESLSYGALAVRVSQFAAGLREAGVRPNDRVGMLMLDTPDLIAVASENLRFVRIDGVAHQGSAAR